MKPHKFSFLLMAGLTLVACTSIDDQYFEGGSQSQEQWEEVLTTLPNRIEAVSAGMYSIMGQPKLVFTHKDANRADDFGFIASFLSQDLEGADMSGQNNGYNWFSVASELSTRDANYANPFMRYKVPYIQIGAANDVIGSIPAGTKESKLIFTMAQARAMRAFAYMQLVPYFQFGDYAQNQDKPSVPIVNPQNRYNNPRATVKEVYTLAMEDLNYAIDHLKGFERGANKFQINQNVAYGLRARLNLTMGQYAEAAADAEKAMQGFTPATIAEVSKPAFCNLDETNWMWGIQVTETMVEGHSARTAGSWFSAFTADGYGPVTENVPMINVLLYNKISDTDVRKGWWLNEKKESPLLEKLVWEYEDPKTKAKKEAKGQEIATLKIDDVKKPYKAYVNVKFGMKKGVGSTINANDFPLMRVEEMILLRAEALARSGNEAGAKQVLTDFVKTYRDPAYTLPSNRTLTDEIWFQRRVELWGEGFFTADAKRMGKPIVRFHDGVESNFPEKFLFNIKADDPWLNMRFPRSEMDQNKGIKNNEGGSIPVPRQNPELRDGVTD